MVKRRRNIQRTLKSEMEREGNRRSKNKTRRERRKGKK